MATADVSARRARRARRKKPRCCILEEKFGLEFLAHSLPRWGQHLPPQLGPLSGPKGSGRQGATEGGLKAAIPGFSVAPHPPPQSPWWWQPGGTEATAAVHAHSLTVGAMLRSLPLQLRSARTAAAPFVSRTGLSRSHGPPPLPPPPWKDPPRPLPSNPHLLRPLSPRLHSRP